jgi:hypothetical protein
MLALTRQAFFFFGWKFSRAFSGQGGSPAKAALHDFPSGCKVSAPYPPSCAKEGTQC